MYRLTQDIPVYFKQYETSMHKSNEVANNLLITVEKPREDRWQYFITDSKRWNNVNNVQFFSEGNPCQLFAYGMDDGCNYKDINIDESCLVVSSKLSPVKYISEAPSDFYNDERLDKNSIGFANAIQVGRVFTFGVPYETKFGQDLYIVGAGKALGNWNPEKAIKLEWTAGHIWKAYFSEEEAKTISEFKFIMKQGYDVTWGTGSNNKFNYDLYKGTTKDVYVQKKFNN